MQLKALAKSLFPAADLAVVVPKSVPSYSHSYSGIVQLTGVEESVS